MQPVDSTEAIIANLKNIVDTFLPLIPCNPRISENLASDTLGAANQTTVHLGFQLGQMEEIGAGGAGTGT